MVAILLSNFIFLCLSFYLYKHRKRLFTWNACAQVYTSLPHVVSFASRYDGLSPWQWRGHWTENHFIVKERKGTSKNKGTGVEIHHPSPSSQQPSLYRATIYLQILLTDGSSPPHWWCHQFPNAIDNHATFTGSHNFSLLLTSIIFKPLDCVTVRTGKEGVRQNHSVRSNPSSWMSMVSFTKGYDSLKCLVNWIFTIGLEANCSKTGGGRQRTNSILVLDCHLVTD